MRIVSSPQPEPQTASQPEPTTTPKRRAPRRKTSPVTTTYRHTLDPEPHRPAGVTVRKMRDGMRSYPASVELLPLRPGDAPDRFRWRVVPPPQLGTNLAGWDVDVRKLPARSSLVIIER